MTPTTLTSDASRATDFQVISLVSAAHFVSHIYILALPPLFPFLRAEFGVSYTELGTAIALFNIFTGALQTPAGFLVDRTSARAVLVGGLVLGAAALALAALVPWFVLFVPIFALTGVANAVYHPADYALLSSRISVRRMSHAYSIHIFAGYLGTAVTPALMIGLAEAISWRGAFLVLAIVAVLVAAAILLFGDAMAGRDPARLKADGSAVSASPDWHILLAPAVLLNLVFYMLIAMTSAGIGNYGIVALEALGHISLPLATTALTAYLGASAIAVLVGGLVSMRTDRHDLVAMAGLGLSAVVLLPIAVWDLGPTMIVLLMALSGFFTGLIMPSRDMLVRSVTPRGAFGKVFGFITTGFNIGGVIAPPIFGFLMDHGSAGGVLIGSALCALLAVPTVFVTVANRGKKAATV